MIWILGGYYLGVPDKELVVFPPWDCFSVPLFIRFQNLILLIHSLGIQTGAPFNRSDILIYFNKSASVAPQVA